jgi:hypothetical protein
MKIQKQPMLRIFSVSFLLVFWLFPSLSAAITASWLGFFPMLIAFLFFAGSILSYGALAERRFGGGWAGVFLYSSLLLCVFALLLGQLGLLHANYLFAAASILGAWFIPTLFRSELWSTYHKYSGRNLRLFLCVFGFALFVRAFAAYLPQAHGDPLLYHLVGPKLWVDMGAAKIFPDLPIALLSSSWEYLYVWPQEIWRNVEGLPRLFAAQVFSQWMHLLWGWIGSAVILYQLLADREKRFSYLLLAVVTAMFMSNVQWPASLAKNDSGVAFWAFGAIYFLREALRSNRLPRFFLSGIFAGLAVIGKLNAGLVLAAGFFLLWPDLVVVWKNQKKKIYLSALGFGSLGFVVAIFPIMWRNYSETGNPLYPLFPQYFPSPWISESWAHHFSALHPKNDSKFLNHILYRVTQILRENPLVYGWLLLPFFSIRAQDRLFLQKIGPWAFFSMAALAILLLGFTPEAEFRYLGGSLMAMGIVGVLSFLHLLEKIPFPGFPHWQVFLLAVVLLASSRLPTHLLWKAKNIPLGESFLLTHSAGDSKDWLRKNVSKEQLIVLVADNESYYLSNLRVTVLTERPDLDKATIRITDLSQFLSALCESSRARFLLDARPELGFLKRFPALQNYKQAIVFQGVSSTVYDLARLEQMVLGAKAQDCSSELSK